MKRLIMLAAVVLVVLMVHAWGVSAVNVSPRVFCEPDCTGVDNRDKVVNPRNCSEFYFCNDGTQLGPFPCDNGTHFDGTSCVDDVVGEECKNECSSESNTCSVTCSNNDFEFISDAFNCSVYYICIPGRPVPLECPNDSPHFDEKTRSCVNNASVCCSGYCDAYCGENDFLVPDPKDCTQYYICDEEGLAKEKYHLQCDGYFSVQLGDCVSDTPPDPCPTLCGATGGASSTTTTTTPSSSTTTTTTTTGGSVTDNNGCVSSLVCTDEGYFPACSSKCERDYFSCSGKGAKGVKSSCPGVTVFNPTSGYGYCILPSNCPYP